MEQRINLKWPCCIYCCLFWALKRAQLSKANKITLDLVHLAKILNSDAIVVLDVNGYIGKSAAKQIEWAEIMGKEIYYLSNDIEPYELY